VKSWLFPQRHLQRVASARAAKAFSQPPFWSLDSSRLPWLTSSLPDREQIENNFEAYVQGAYKGDGVVFSCIASRLYLFAQARFAWQDYVNGTPGDLYGNQELRLLEQPGVNMTTGNLLGQAEVDASLAGNNYATTVDNNGRMGRAATGEGRRVARMRPDWVTLVIGSRSDDPYALDARVVGLIYEPPLTGAYRTNRADPVVLLPEEVAHFAPLPDPVARYRGMSWLTPVLREIDADRAATTHKARFFDQGATLRTVVSLDKDVSPDAFDAFVERFETEHMGADNAYKTLFLGGGADVTVVSADMQQMDFRHVQGATETRVAAAAGVHPVVVGLSEGLAGSSLNAGNFKAACRLTVDKTLTYLWAEVAASYQALVTPPRSNTVLTMDLRNVPFLREDASDVANIQQMQASALRQLWDGGMDPDAAIDFLLANDLRKLRSRHTGNLSVQLQPADPAAQAESASNGHANGRALDRLLSGANGR
jgi:phage portal protein BeeE